MILKDIWFKKNLEKIKSIYCNRVDVEIHSDLGLIRSVYKSSIDAIALSNDSVLIEREGAYGIKIDNFYSCKFINTVIEISGYDGSLEEKVTIVFV